MCTLLLNITPTKPIHTRNYTNYTDYIELTAYT